MSASIQVRRLPDGSAEYTATEGDTIDLVCRLFYGQEWDTTEMVMEANYGLELRGSRLPTGAIVKLPRYTPPAATARDTINLWD